jgi:hypothetical protein
VEQRIRGGRRGTTEENHQREIEINPNRDA